MGAVTALQVKTQKQPTTNNRKVARSREYLTPDRDATLMLLACRHGLRVSELVELRWDQVDFKAGLLHVNRAKNGIASVHPLRGPELRALRRPLWRSAKVQRRRHLTPPPALRCADYERWKTLSPLTLRRILRREMTPPSTPIAPIARCLRRRWLSYRRSAIYPRGPQWWRSRVLRSRSSTTRAIVRSLFEGSERELSDTPAKRAYDHRLRLCAGA
jgi:hypothetical protein